MALRVAAPTLSDCPGGRPVRQEQAQGMLVAALGLLVAHYGLDGRPWSSLRGASGRLAIAEQLVQDVDLRAQARDAAIDQADVAQ